MFRIGSLFLTVAIFVFRVDNQAFRKELIENIASHIHQSASVIPKVNDQIFHTLRVQIIKGCNELVIRHVIEFTDTDITDLICNQPVLHRRNFNAPARQRQIQHIRASHETCLHIGSLFTFQIRYNQIQIHSGYFFPFYFIQNIIRLYPCLRSR